MARKVKETPILSGRDAEVFTRAIKANESKKVSSNDYARAIAVFDRVNNDSPRQK